MLLLAFLYFRLLSLLFTFSLYFLFYLLVFHYFVLLSVLTIISLVSLEHLLIFVILIIWLLSFLVLFSSSQFNIRLYILYTFLIIIPIGKASSVQLLPPLLPTILILCTYQQLQHLSFPSRFKSKAVISFL